MQQEKSGYSSLGRRFAVATALLATFALLLTTTASWWLASRQHAAEVRELSLRETQFHASTIGATLHALSARMSEIADSPILATALVDSAGRETYLEPYLNGIRQINGVPIALLFTDFEGQEIASNGGRFGENELAWLRKQIDTGEASSTVLDVDGTPYLVAVNLLRYSRTQTPEGALLYKVALSALLPAKDVSLVWKGRTAPAAESGMTMAAVDLPVPYRLLEFRIFEPYRHDAATGMMPEYGAILAFAILIGSIVLFVGSRIARRLTRDLQELDTYAQSVVQEGFGKTGAPGGNSREVNSLSRSINAMLARLFEQHSLLEAEREKLLQLANTIPQLAWMGDASGRVQWHNDRWHEYTGCSRDTLLAPDWRRHVFDADALPKIEQDVQSGIASGKPFSLSVRLRGKDGISRPFLLSAAPLRNAAGEISQWFCTDTDVSSIERAEQALRDREERLREGMAAARMAVWDWDLASGEMQVSANSEEIFGRKWLSIEDMMEQVHPADVEGLQDAIVNAVSARGGFEHIVRLVPAIQGGEAWIDVRGKILCDGNGEPTTVRGISLDVTERKKAELALRMANQRKDEFLAMLAHELRNPLAPINTAADILQVVAEDAGRVRKTSEIISRQVKHMTDLIDDLLDVSRVTRGLITLDRKPVNIKDVAAAAIEQVGPLLDARRQSLTVEYPDQDAWVQADRTRLIQVLSNLLNNAAKYTQESGDILLSIVTRDDEVEIRLRDNGVGIAPELLPYIFDLFTQAERTPDRAQGGLGLGLALVRSVVQLHGGTVTAHSEGRHRGSMFVVRLPRIESPLLQSPSPVPDASSQPSAVHQVSLKSAQALDVMIVDDNADAAFSLAVLLESQGHRVIVENSSKTALHRVTMHPAMHVPQLFLLDIGLPEMDGYALCMALRADPVTANAVIVAVTGYGREEDRKKSAAAGFDAHLTKPVDRASLAQIMARVNERPSQGALVKNYAGTS
jgi:PAS domain S-box-containing protein